MNKFAGFNETRIRICFCKTIFDLREELSMRYHGQNFNEGTSNPHNELEKERLQKEVERKRVSERKREEREGEGKVRERESRKRE